jgi:hypothetical protein
VHVRIHHSSEKVCFSTRVCSYHRSRIHLGGRIPFDLDERNPDQRGGPTERVGGHTGCHHASRVLQRIITFILLQLGTGKRSGYPDHVYGQENRRGRVLKQVEAGEEEGQNPEITNRQASAKQTPGRQTALDSRYVRTCPAIRPVQHSQLVKTEMGASSEGARHRAGNCGDATDSTSETPRAINSRRARTSVTIRHTDHGRRVTA